MLRVPQFEVTKRSSRSRDPKRRPRKHGADLGLSPINGRAVDVAVAILQSCFDGGADLAGRRLPRAQADDGHGLAGVELKVPSWAMGVLGASMMSCEGDFLAEQQWCLC